MNNLGVNYALCAEGDDGYIIMRRSWADEAFGEDVLSKLSDYCAKTGFEDKFILCRGVGGDFCSKWWYPNAGSFLLGGKIGRVLAKAGYMLDKTDNLTIRSAAIGQLQDNHHVPFLKEYFERVVILARKLNMPLRGKPGEYSHHAGAKHEYDDSTLDFVQDKYGLTRSDLSDFVKILNGIHSLPIVISWPHLHRCMQIDAAE